jgi:DNA-binding transcriptional ArsR family regulator
MVYKHRTKYGKVRHYQSKGAYQNSMKAMFAKDSKKNPQRMQHKKTIPISSKDRKFNAQFIRRARRGKGKPVSRPISKRMRHGEKKRLTPEQRKEREAQMQKLMSEKLVLPEPKSKTPNPRQKTDKQARERIYQVLSEASDPVSLKEIKEKTGGTDRNIAYGLKKLKEQNLVQTIPNLQDTRKKLFTTSSRKPLIPIK